MKIFLRIIYCYLEEIFFKIADRIRSNIQSSTEGLIEINTINIDDKFVIEIIVASGIEKPYYIKNLEFQHLAVQLELELKQYQ